LSADVIAKAQAGEATIELHDSCLRAGSSQLSR
jgi:hypothetical protein